ncbi:MAG: tRNA pseudouridine(38-40) synthase TruA [Clostridia bacterium]|nr:tRNA pseudouridine(38-40) synthase TruA [Clostridia bacterium]
MQVEFDGTQYAGWQRQANVLSVQECLESAVEALTGEQLAVIGCSRTDAGVHALGLVCHMDTACRIPPERMPFALNTKLPEDIRVRAACAAPPGFHARYSTCAKAYRYTFYNSRQMCAIGRQYAMHVPVPMNETRMLEAAEALIGTHDFAAFAASGNVSKSTVRTVYALRIWRDKERIHLCIMGDGFLYNMVRIIAGTLAEIGTGKRPVDAFCRGIETGDRLCLGPTAPACGLTLEQVFYEGDEAAARQIFMPELTGVRTLF